MNVAVVYVSTNTELWERVQPVWQAHGFGLVNADAMGQGIARLWREPSVLCGLIDADSISYLPMLRTMSDNSPVPIFIFTSGFTMEKEIEALQNGAAGYAQRSDNEEENVELILAMRQSYDLERKRDDKPMVWRDLVVDGTQHRAFMKSREVVGLSPTQFDLLHFFALNRCQKLSAQYIYSRVWKNDDAHDVEKCVSQQVLKLKQILSEYTDGDSYIETIWGVGYRMI